MQITDESLMNNSLQYLTSTLKDSKETMKTLNVNLLE
jgi:hypothetical protein